MESVDGMALRDRTNEFLAIVENVVLRDGGLQGQGQLPARLAANSSLRTSVGAKTPLLGDGNGNQNSNGNENYEETIAINQAIIGNITKSEFARAAAQIGRDLNSVVVRLQSLAKLAKRKSLFDDKPMEINSLISEIKQEIAKLNANIGQLQAWQRTKLQNNRNNVGSGKQSQEHSIQVVTSLQAKLATTSEAFKTVLEIRTQNMKEQKDRKDQFSASSNPSINSVNSLSRNMDSNNKMYNNQNSLNSSNGSAFNTPLGNDANLGGSGNPSFDSPLYNPDRRRGGKNNMNFNSQQNGIVNISGLALGASGQPRSRGSSQVPYNNNNSNSVAIDFGDSDYGSNSGGYQQQQQLVPMNTMNALNQELIESRSTAIESIESTIAELGQIYQSFASMVAAQREMVQRIDENVLDIEMNVQGAHSQLMTFYQNVSSNRWLIIKVLAVLVVFFLMFVIAT